ncbi:MAG: DNA mismatch repair endonuclease MutL [Deltaproteobacteria bacterium]|nr:DNA mismatch repair endonuclease MutL [Deltaproteobacteria bacterium]
MSKIKILPEILSNKIAAGEVVERPSSVVKELLENSLDAKSTRVIIEVDNGGLSLMRVSDNGIGMSRDDALLSLERYATSKIYKDRDLFSINTLGFRGEALPSIASVSKFSLITKDEISEAGTEIFVDGGTIKKVSEIGAPMGTMITVRNLFFNTPARRKFLKTVKTEMVHIAEAVANIALGWPDVQFKLYHNGKIVKNWYSSPDPFNRVLDVVGNDMKNDLLRIKFEDNFISGKGWISSHRVSRKTSRGIYIYINGRVVRDRGIQHALFEGYAGRLMKGQFPVAVFFIRVPYDQVDVNVHPSKHEVRLAQQNQVHKAVIGAVSEALHIADRSKWSAENFSGQKPFCVSEPVARYNESIKLKDIPAFSAVQKNLWEEKRFSNLRVVGQFHDTYILCESDEELVLIDQHAAHERVLFEHLKKLSMNSKIEVQKFLVPETIDIGYREADTLEKLIPDLKKLGLEIEPFGGTTFVVKSVPAILADREIKPIILEIAEKMLESGLSQGLEKTIDQCLMLIACHGAIKANQRLSDKQTSALLAQLDECENSSHCPHGRPTWISWTLESVEKSFKRIV